MVLKMTLAVVPKMNWRRLETEAAEQLELTAVVQAMNGQGLAGGNGKSQKRAEWFGRKMHRTCLWINVEGKGRITGQLLDFWPE